MTNQNNDKSKNGKRIALILVALLLIAAIAFGAYTYSKYVTSGEGGGDADVAAWGYTVTIGDTDDDDPFFAVAYSKDGDEAESTEKSVIASVSSPQTEVVAPGAKGSTTITVSGKAEVNAVLSMAVNMTSEIYVELSGTGSSASTTLYYIPILFTLKQGDTAVSGCENVPLANLKAALASNADLSGKILGVSDSVNETYTLSWAWSFEGTPESEGQPQNTLWTADGDGTYSEHETKITAADVDSLDTILGQTAASIALPDSEITVGGDPFTIGTCETDITFDFVVTVTQTMQETAGD